MAPANARSSADRRVWLMIGAMVLAGLLLIPLSQLVFGLRLTYTVRVVAWAVPSWV